MARQFVLVNNGPHVGPGTTYWDTEEGKKFFFLSHTQFKPPRVPGIPSVELRTKPPAKIARLLVPDAEKGPLPEMRAGKVCQIIQWEDFVVLAFYDQPSNPFILQIQYHSVDFVMPGDCMGVLTAQTSDFKVVFSMPFVLTDKRGQKMPGRWEGEAPKSGQVNRH